MDGKRWGVIAGFIFLFILSNSLTAQAGELSLNLGAARMNRQVLSYQEIRQAKTIRQKWDRSCGSAALSTILTHHYGDGISEAVIIMSILRVADPSKIRARGGFSLLDLKRFLELRGYEGKGYGGMSLEELAGLGAPAIVPVRMRGYDHFVVFRGIRGDRVSLSDPAFGTLTMKIPRFLEIWKGGVGFIVLRKGFEPPLKGLSPREEEFLIPDGTSVTRAALRLDSTSLSRRAP